MKRRAFLKSVSMSTAMANSLALAEAQTAEIGVDGNQIFLRRYGRGPAILMIHGFPRTSLMWRFLTPKLADHTVICVDLRAYGRSGIPASADDHFPYSKRAMAKELVDVMAKLGFPTFTLIGHDRGGRVAYRMALDHPKNVERLAVFDVIPILEAWSRTDTRFAQTYWPWILRKRSSIIPSGRVPLAPRFSTNTFPRIATRRECMESARSIEPRRRSMSNTIAPTSRLQGESNVPCCICGPKVVRWIACTRKTAVHWASGGNGLHACMDNR